MRWLIAFHVVGVVMWMGSLMALSRILGYHVREPATVRPRFSFLEGRLDLFGAVPGAVLTLATGLGQLALEPDRWFSTARWMHVKLLLVLVLVVLHVMLLVRHRRLARQRADQVIPRGFFAAAHGMIGLLLIAIVVLAVVRPF
jgi:protoporphyrinogen IX oxidase